MAHAAAVGRVCWLAVWASTACSAATFTVTNNFDFGTGSLRQALMDAAAAPGPHEIAIDVPPGSGRLVIQPATILPPITESVFLNGASHPDYGGKPLVQIDGRGLSGLATPGLTIEAGGDSSKLSGLAIRGCPGPGLLIRADGVVVNGCWIGTDSAGRNPVPNEVGIRIDGGHHNLIGDDPAVPNVISGNDLLGVEISGLGAADNQLNYNVIGLAVGGNDPCPNGGGAFILGATGTRLADNTISGNLGPGVRVSGPGSDHTLLVGNGLGVPVSGGLTGRERTGNQFGVLLDGCGPTTIGGMAAGGGNTIAGSVEDGISLAGVTGDVLLLGNRIGTTVSGLLAMGNANGVRVVHGDGQTGQITIQGNLISGNRTATGDGAGIILEDGGDLVIGNVIGLDATGTRALPNDHGLRILGGTGHRVGSPTPGEGNTVSGNQGWGIWLELSVLTELIGNLVGLDTAGVLPLPNGAGGVAARVPTDLTVRANTISGHAGDGLCLEGVAGGLVVEGNQLGTDAGGVLPVGNGVGLRLVSSATCTIGGQTAAQRNVIGGNVVGLRIEASCVRVMVRGNRVGASLDGLELIPNGTGVEADGPQTVLDSNDVAGNTTLGVAIGPAAFESRLIGNTVRQNGDRAPPPGVFSGGVQVAAEDVEIGGPGSTQRNRVHGNLGPGLEVAGAGASGARINNNWIGTNDGSTASANTGDGLLIRETADATVTDNLISGNGRNGIEIRDTILPADTTATIRDNLVGLNASGTAALPNSVSGIALLGVPGVVVEGGVVSGNGQWGFELAEHPAGDDGDGPILRGVTVGLNAAGDAAVPNRLTGVAASLPINGLLVDGCIVSGNGLSGLALSGSGQITNCRIGVGTQTDLPLGNHRSGLSLGGDWTVTDCIVANTAPYVGQQANGAAGLQLSDGTGRFERNRVFSNGTVGIALRRQSPAATAVLLRNEVFDNNIQIGAGSGHRLTAARLDDDGSLTAVVELAEPARHIELFTPVVGAGGRQTGQQFLGAVDAPPGEDFAAGLQRFTVPSPDVRPGDLAQLTVTGGDDSGLASTTGLFEVGVQKAATPARLEFVSQHFDLAEVGVAVGATIQVVDSNGGPYLDEPVPVTVSLAEHPAGAAQLLGPTTVQSQFSRAQLDVELSLPGHGFVLSFTTPGAPALRTDPFYVRPRRAAALRFRQAPVSGPAGLALQPAPVVETLDADGATIVGGTGQVTIEVRRRQSEQAAVTQSATVVDGAAVFPELVIRQPDQYYCRATYQDSLLRNGDSSADRLPEPLDSDGFEIAGATGRTLRFVDPPATSAVDLTIEPAVRVEALDQNGQRDTAVAGTATLGLRGSGGVLSGPTMAPFLGGVATFDGVAVTRPGDYQLTAATDQRPTVETPLTDTAPADEAGLLILQHPNDVAVGDALNPSVEVAVINRFGQLLPDARGTVSVALADGASGTLQGTLTQPVSGTGGATFADLRSITPGDGLRLTFSRAGLPTVTSLPFGCLAARERRLAFLPFGDPQPGASVSLQVLNPDGSTYAPPAGTVTRLGFAANPVGSALLRGARAEFQSATARFLNLRWTAGGDGFVFQATVAGARPVYSRTFSLADLRPVLLFTGAPRGGEAGEPLTGVRVEARDGAGDVLGGYTGPLTISVLDGPAGVALGGTTTRAAINGAIEFGDLTLDRPGRYRLRARADSFGDGTSLEFVVSPVLNQPPDGTSESVVLEVPPGVHLRGVPFDVDNGLLAELLAVNRAGLVAVTYRPEAGFVPLRADNLAALDPDSPSVVPRGTGLWFDNRTPFFLGVPGQVDSSESELVVPLQQGYNLLGNPFATDLLWRLDRFEVLQSGNLIGPLSDPATWRLVAPYGWVLESGVYRLVLDPRLPGTDGVRAVLQPFEGFWMEALATDVAVRFRLSTSLSRAAANRVDRRHWTVRLLAASGDGSAEVRFGVVASFNSDLTIAEPPRPDRTAVAMSLVREGRALSGDIRRAAGADQQWEVRLTSRDGQPVALSWPGLLRQLPAGVLLYLNDPSTGESVLLNTRASHLWRPARAGETRVFHVLSRSGTVHRAIITGLAAVPGRGRGVAINLTVTGPATIAVNVRGLGGKLVRSFTRTATEAGPVAIGWDGTDQQGRLVPRGSYMVEASAVSSHGASSRAVRIVGVE